VPRDPAAAARGCPDRRAPRHAREEQHDDRADADQHAARDVQRMVHAAVHARGRDEDRQHDGGAQAANAQAAVRMADVRSRTSPA
jgi:hypothetical protein